MSIKASHLSPDPLPLRPAGHPRPADHPAAAGAAFAHPGALSHSLKVSPAEHFVNLQQDPYGNWLARFVFPEPVTELKIEVDLVADMTVYNPFDFFVEPAAETWPFDYPEDIRDDLVDLHEARAGRPARCGASSPRSTASADATRSTSSSTSTRGSQREIGYVIRMEPACRRPEETLRAAARARAAISSWLLVQVLRNLGFAARFVSGYLIQLKPDLVALDGPPGTDHDFTDLHAWCEVYLPGAGWIGLDPTSGLLTGESHIPLAATPHYRNAAPISGMASFANVDFAFDMRVDPRRRAPAHHQAVLRRSLGGARRARRRGRRARSPPATCA